MNEWAGRGGGRGGAGAVHLVGALDGAFWLQYSTILYCTIQKNKLGRTYTLHLCIHRILVKKIQVKITVTS